MTGIDSWRARMARRRPRPAVSERNRSTAATIIIDIARITPEPFNVWRLNGSNWWWRRRRRRPHQTVVGWWLVRMLRLPAFEQFVTLS